MDCCSPIRSIRKRHNPAARKQPKPTANRSRNPNVPTNQARTTRKIITIVVCYSIPSQIASLVLTSTSNLTPHDLVQAITSHLDTANANDQKYLKQQAERAHFMSGMTLQEYISMHESIRANMIAARYPEIQNPRTTVIFMIDLLRTDPTTAVIGTQLIALNPENLKSFAHKYNRIATYQTVAQQQEQIQARRKPSTTTRRWPTSYSRRQPAPDTLSAPAVITNKEASPTRNTQT